MSPLAQKVFELMMARGYIGKDNPVTSREIAHAITELRVMTMKNVAYELYRVKNELLDEGIAILGGDSGRYIAESAGEIIEAAERLEKQAQSRKDTANKLRHIARGRL